MTLSRLDSEQHVRVIGISGGKSIRQKLALRGISEGENLRIISNRGPVTVKVNGNTVTIGRGMASKVKVCRT
ncbi:MAG: ferrous iron transport protein A [Candidatus Acetothermia bacterium]